DGPAERRFGIARSRCDVRPTHAWEIDRVDRESVSDTGNDELEVIKLRSHRVQQDQRWTGTRLQVPQARPVGKHGVLDLARPSPGAGVVAVRLQSDSDGAHAES